MYDQLKQILFYFSISLVFILYTGCELESDFFTQSDEGTQFTQNRSDFESTNDLDNKDMSKDLTVDEDDNRDQSIDAFGFNNSKISFCLFLI